MARLSVTPAHWPIIEDRILQGLRVPEIAREIGVSDDALLWSLKKRPDLDKIRNKAKGGGKSNISAVQWSVIETLTHQGLDIKQIAEQIGMPRTTLQNALRSRPDLKLILTTHPRNIIPIEVYDRAVIMLRNDRTLSIKLTAKRLGISYGALKDFLKSVGLHAEFAKMFHKDKTGLSQNEIKRRADKRARKIRLTPFEVYRDIRNDKLYLAVSDRELLRPTGQTLGRNIQTLGRNIHEPRSIHTTIGWDGVSPLTTEDLLFDWGITQAQLDALVDPFFTEWRQEVEAAREASPQKGKLKGTSSRGEYKGMTPTRIRLS